MKCTTVSNRLHTADEELKLIDLKWSYLIEELSGWIYLVMNDDVLTCVIG